MDVGQQCHITDAIDEQSKLSLQTYAPFFLLCVSATGTLLKLPGNNPVQPEGKPATMVPAASTPPLISPVFAYTGALPTATGQIVTPGQNNVAAAEPVVPGTTSTPTPPVSSTSSASKGSATQPTPPAVVPPVAAPPAAPPVAATSGSPSAPVLAAIPTASQAPPVVPPAVSPTAHSNAPSSSPTSGYGTCKKRSSKRDLGLEHHRRHRRSSYI